MALFNAQKIRSQAAQSLHTIAFEGQSSSDVLANIEFENPSDTSLYKAIVLGSCRYFERLDALSHLLLRKPFKPKDRDLLCLLIVGLYQLEYSRVPDHAAISETVDGCRQLKKEWATKLLNGVLRSYLRQKEALAQQLDHHWDTKFSFPEWLIKRIKPHYKGQVEQILEQSNQQAPMSLRINRMKTSRADFCRSLDEVGLGYSEHPLVSSAVVLDQAVPVLSLPGFEQGMCSVQDVAAQLAAQLLAPKPDQKVLDACAAPGGKSAHLLEFTDNRIQLDAVDIDPIRCFRIQENLERLELSATIHDSDVTRFLHNQTDHYDAILLDVPCSATGVIRRHPDIKLLRRDSDIAELQQIQNEILDAAWTALKPGGKLLYATCSILFEENEQQITAFLDRTHSANLVDLPEALVAISHAQLGCQIIPGTGSMDGFYYALLQKSS
ncbi:16S rRNA (cytosine(967)-C(5))-methyltransferase RsmB [Kangiella marina]|uniref:16S rRNA (cytosine(967)-C(5))-methyltransferase n=1 Tax=Kangiella marina TaxID=1079178 RepID=A0ABP8IJH3_9GAMM